MQFDDNTRRQAGAARQVQYAKELFRRGAFDEAERACKSLLAHPATRAEALFGLGMIRARTGQSAEATKLFEQCLDISPRSADAHVQLALLSAANDPAAAVDHYRQALAISSDHAQARDGLRRLTDGGRTGAIDAPPSIDADSGASGFDTLLLSDHQDPMSRGLSRILSELRLKRRLSLFAFPLRLLLWPIVLGAASFVVLLAARQSVSRSLITGEEALAVAAAVSAVTALVVAARIVTTKISIDDGRVRVARGVLFREVSYVELARVTDVSVRRGPIGLITGYGRLTLTVGAQQSRLVDLTGIARGRALYELAERLRQAAIALRASRWGRDVLVWR